jgi:hypothetical protein
LVLVLLAIPAIVLCVSCGSDDNGPGPPDTTPPTIASVSPADGATDVGLIERVKITFSEPMDVGSISGAAIIIEEQPVRGYFDYDAAARTAYVIPETLYTPEAPYRITIEEGFQDLAGNDLAAPDTFHFETGVLDCEHLADYFEPNEEIAEAAAIETDVIYPTLSVCGEDEDFFEFTLDQAARVTIRCLMRASDGESWLMQFLRADGEDFIWRSAGGIQGETKQLPRTFLPGTYYARILCQEEPAEYDYILYDFELATSDPCEDDPWEDNDFLDEAPLISPGTLDGLRGCGHDYDYFAIELDAGDTITAAFTSEPFDGSQTRRFRIQDPTGGVLVSSMEQLDELTLETTATESGTYYVSAKYWTEAQAVEYRIVIAVS